MRLLLALPVVAAASVMGLAACAADSPNAAVSLTPEGEAGHQVFLATGCATCHGRDGTGAAARGFDGMWGTTVGLTDGSSVVYDADFVTRAIRDPGAEKRTGSASVQMPGYDTAALSDEDLAAMLVFIEELGQAG